MAETIPNYDTATTNMGNAILFIGAPGSGKATQGIRMAKEFDGIFISTGDLLRSVAGSKSNLGNRVKSIISEGGIVQSDSIYLIIEKKISIISAYKFLFFDFAGTPDQFRQLPVWFNQYGRRLRATFYLEVSEKELFFRLQKRGREDDTPHLIEKRLRLFYRDLNEILNACTSHENHYKVNGQRNPEEISLELIRYIRHLN